MGPISDTEECNSSDEVDNGRVTTAAGYLSGTPSVRQAAEGCYPAANNTTSYKRIGVHHGDK